jgi:hypothetical protein
VTAVVQLRALRALASGDPTIAALEKKYLAVLGPEILLGVVLQDDAAVRRAATLPAMQEVVQRIKDEDARFPARYSASDWAIMRHLDAPVAEKMAASLKADEGTALVHRIGLTLSPGNPSETVQAGWLYLLTGQPDKAREVAKSAADLGIELPTVR